MIVLEYLPYGDLLGYLRKSRGHEDTYNTGEKRPNSRLTEKDLLSFAWMIGDGMSYLATMKVHGLFSGINDEVINSCLLPIECFHMTSLQQYWYPEIKKREPYWCSQSILWELNNFLMQSLSFVLINLHDRWPRLLEKET